MLIKRQPLSSAQPHPTAPFFRLQTLTLPPMESSAAPAINELTRVHELAEKLAAHLRDPPQVDFCRALAEQILFSVERVIFIVGRGDWPISGGGFQHASDDHQMPKKRKTLPKWTGQVRGPEGLRDDGHAWRKYGQKDILNSKHPRAYYRCSHSKAQGCPAIKQVQRCDENPAVFNVTYRGTHTCTRSAHPAFPRCPGDSPQSLLEQGKSRAPKAECSSHFLASDETSLIFDDLFGPSSNPESCFLGSLSPTFMSPTTSDSNCFPWSPRQRSIYVNQNADLTDIVLAATSATNSQMDMSFGDEGLEDSILCAGAGFRWPM